MSIHTTNHRPPSGRMGAMKTFAWNIRRELWEHRALYIAPFAIGLVALAGYLLLLFNVFGTAERFTNEKATMRTALLITPFSAATFAIMATAALASFYYCLDALYGERRDRSILFWKSLPVSDANAVLAKFAVPMIAMIPIELAIIFMTQLAMMIAALVVLSLSGVGAGFLWENYPFARMSLGVVYGLATSTLWYAPVYAWFLLVSGWAKRAPLLWASMPFVAAMVIERVTFGSTQVYSIVVNRIFGGADAAFTEKTVATGARAGDARATVEQLRATAEIVAPEPAKFFSNPELWIGLVLAAVFVFAAIRLRRSRAPM
jgi:ABC-2 type transport system permease protein